MIWHILMVILYLIPGSYAAKVSIAKTEARILMTYPKQDHMDKTDWTDYAAPRAIISVATWPLLFTIWALGYPVRLLYKPARAYMLPPIQAKFEAHVQEMDNQKALVIAAARTYADVLDWQPDDHPDRLAMLKNLEDDLRELMNQLMRMADTSNPTGYDGNYLMGVKDEMKAITQGHARGAA